MEICNGDGTCLDQGNDMKYHVGLYRGDIQCVHNCVPIQCPNYIICRNKEPQWLLQCSSDICQDCDMMGYNTLNVTDDNEDCPICLDNKKSIILKCNHTVCIDCFRIAHFPDDIEPEYPPCPFGEDIYERFLNGDSTLVDNQELIDYQSEVNRLDDERDNRNDEISQSLENCPICRHPI